METSEKLKQFNINKANITLETIPHSGHLVFRYHTRNGDCIKQVYIGYTKTEANQIFIQYLIDEAQFCLDMCEAMKKV